MTEAGAAFPDRHGHDEAIPAGPPSVWTDGGVSFALFEQSPLSTVIYDTEGHVLAANPAFEALWGVSPRAVPPGYSVLTDPELERAGIIPELRRAFEGSPVTLPPVRYDISRVARTGAGRTVWTQGHVYPVRGAGGRVTHVVLTHVDVTPVMQAEAALRDSEERFRGAQEGSPDGFGVLQPVRDENGAIVDFVWEYANPAATRAQGMTEGELIGARLLTLSPAAGEAGLLDAYARTVQTGEPFVTEVHYRHQRVDGWFRITAVRLGSSIAVTFSDVTPRKRAEERIRGLLALAAGLSEAATPEQVADVVFREGLQALNADGGSLGVVRDGDEGEVVEMVHTRGYGAEAEARYRRIAVTPGRPLSDAILSGRPVLLASREAWDARYPGHFANVEPLGFEAYAALPVIVGNRTVAGMSFSFRGARTFDAETVTFLEAIGRLCAQALERARAYEAELRERERSQTILAAVTDGFVAFDRDFRYTFVNGRAAEILGFPAGRLLGRTVWEMFPTVERTEFGPMLRAAMAGRSEQTLEGFSAGLGRWLDVRCYPAQEGLVLFFQDVTERRRARESQAFLSEVASVLASSLEYETTLRSLARAAVPRLADWCAVDMIVDPTVAEWPPRLERLAVVHQDPARLDWARDFAERQPTDWSADTGMARVFREGATEFYPRIDEALLAGAARSPEELERLREIHLSALIIVPLVARGRTLGALTLIMAESGRRYDEADRRLAEELAARAAVAVDNARLYREAERARHEAEAANRAKSDFLATMSHELRTPLNAIGGYTQLLEMELRGPLTAEQRSDLERIRRSQEHLLGLINAVLNFARLEAGRVTYDPVEFEIDELVREAVELMDPQARSHGLTLTQLPCDTRMTARADVDKVRQVVLNLLSNALKFTPPGGSVTVACEPAGGVVRVRVSDTGVGIAADQLARIFDPFVQVGRSLSAPQEGTGLGLAISRDLARGMGGDLTAESTPGQGSAFTLIIPVRAEGAAGR